MEPKAELQPDATIVEKLASSVENLSNSLIQIESLLSKLVPEENAITLNAGLYGVFVVLVGALSAYLFNYFHWRMESKKSELSVLVDALTSLVNELERASISYWLTSYQDSSEQKNHALAIQIKSNRHLSSTYIKLISSQLNTKQHDSVKKDLECFNQKMFELLTGDSFETRDRMMSKSRATKISVHCVRIKAAIITLRHMNG